MSFKIAINYPDGSSEVEDEIFETEAEAEEYGAVCCSEYRAGGEVLHMSNPGDYPLNDDEANFEVIEV